MARCRLCGDPFEPPSVESDLYMDVVCPRCDGGDYEAELAKIDAEEWIEFDEQYDATIYAADQ
jgi:hypothetical protein